MRMYDEKDREARKRLRTLGHVGFIMGSKVLPVYR
jgi:hypothetical protein